MPLLPHETPTLPLEYQVLNALHSRMRLSSNLKQHHDNLHKGYIGEMAFYDFLSEKPLSNHTLLNGLRLKSNNSEFQLDSLLLRQNKIFLFEVKNFVGDFYIERKNWYISPSGKEINNPLIQLKRSESLLRQFIQQSGFNFPVESYVIFINPEFALFQAPINLPIVLPAQLNRFFNEILIHPQNPTESLHQLVHLLTENHFEDSSYARIPEYNYDHLKKGITCNSCPGLLSYLHKTKLICYRCQVEELIESAVMRSVKEFNLLFPHKKITTNLIYEWCAIIPSKKTIRRVLSQNLNVIPMGRASHYIYKN